MMVLCKETIAAMAASGIGFLVSVPAPGGCCTISLDASDVPKFMADRDQFAATHFGVSRQQYLDWVETDGLPRCGAKTTKGKRCANSVKGGSQRTIADWIELDGGYCSVHGGD